MVRLHHMLDHAQEAVGMVRNRCRTDLDTDRMLNLALVRLMEIVGEAAVWFQRSSGPATRKYPGVTWQTCVLASPPDSWPPHAWLRLATPLL
jgi:uncharacterized protein with HEPN domain